MSDEYKVGKGKPPKHSQYPPGTSGNKGRRKKAPESLKEMGNHINLWSGADYGVTRASGVALLA